MTQQPFDADAVLRYAEQLGLDLLPWQVDVVRAMAAGQLATWPSTRWPSSRRNEIATIRTLIDEYSASSVVAKQDTIDSE